MNTKYETIFPKKVYRCSCLLNTVDECFQSGECSLIKILDSIMCYDFYLPILLEQIFCTRVGENKEGSLIVCREHLIVILLSKKKYSCTSTEDGRLEVPALQGRFCRGCIMKCMREMFSYFYSVDFN